MKSWFTKQPNR